MRKGQGKAVQFTDRFLRAQITLHWAEDGGHYNEHRGLSNG